MFHANSPDLKDRILCAALYSAVFIPIISWAPLVWLLVINIRRMNVKDFIRYHCYQSLLLNMIIFFLPALFSVLINFISTFLSLFLVFENTANILQWLSNTIIPLYFWLIRILAVYAMIWTLRGKYTQIPIISQGVNLMLR